MLSHHSRGEHDSRLGSELLYVPALARARVPVPLVEPVVSVLPELDRLRLEDVATPAVGSRQVIAGQETLELGLELLAAADRLALARSRRCGAGAGRARL